MRFDFIVGKPGYDGGHARPAPQRRRAAACATPTEALEAPNEFDHFNGGPRLGGAAHPLQPRAVPQGQAQPVAARRCRCSAPRSATAGAPAASATSAPSSTSATSTPTRAASRPTRSTCAPSSPAAARSRAASRCGRPRPASTTRCAARRREQPRRVRARRARSTCCARSSSTSSRGIAPHLRLRAARREARPARARPGAALRPAAPRLLAQAGLQGAAGTCSALMGRASRARRGLRPLRLDVQRARPTCTGSCCRRPTARYLVALWRTASVWDRDAQARRCASRRGPCPWRFPRRSASRSADPGPLGAPAPASAAPRPGAAARRRATRSCSRSPRAAERRAALVSRCLEAGSDRLLPRLAPSTARCSPSRTRRPSPSYLSRPSAAGRGPAAGCSTSAAEPARARACCARRGSTRSGTDTSARFLPDERGLLRRRLRAPAPSCRTAPSRRPARST